MKRTIILFLALWSICCCCYSQTQKISFDKIGESIYARSFVNVETNKLDTLFLSFNADSTFYIQSNLGIEMIGRWENKRSLIILTNKFSSDKFLSVKVVPLRNNCNGYLPSIVNEEGNIANYFYLDANQNSYTSGDLVPYVELDTAGKVRICSLTGSHCSDWFIIPYKDCYSFIVDMNVNPNIYNGAIKKFFLKKKGNRLILLKSELSRR